MTVVLIAASFSDSASSPAVQQRLQEAQEMLAEAGHEVRITTTQELVAEPEKFDSDIEKVIVIGAHGISALNATLALTPWAARSEKRFDYDIQIAEPSCEDYGCWDNHAEANLREPYGAIQELIRLRANNQLLLQSPRLTAVKAAYHAFKVRVRYPRLMRHSRELRSTGPSDRVFSGLGACKSFPPSATKRRYSRKGSLLRI